MPGAQRPAPVQPHRTLPAPPVYRPQSAPAVLQAKRAGANVAAPQGFGKTPTPARQANAVGVIQRRTYSDSVIGNFITANKAEYLGESGTVDVNAITAEFKRLNPQYDRADLKYLRKTVSGHRDALAPSPAVINYPLAADFNNHVLGNVAGVGWHSETVNANGEVGYSYNLGGDIASTKRTYWATHLQINGTNKVGNNGRGTFFPDDMAIGEIRSEALYVANTYAKHGQVIIGRGQTTGIMIECLIRDDEVQSAYPYKPGW